MIKALVFDFDGLILDTEVPEFQTWQEVYREHGQTLALETWAACIGTADHGFDPYVDLEGKVGRALDREAIRTRRRARLDAVIERQAPLPGVVDYLVAAGALGLGLAVASSSRRVWVEGHLERLNLRQYFQAVRCADDVTRTKPDPALYLSATAALNVAPDEALALEDSPNGALAAKRAGLYCVVVPNALTASLALDHADRRLGSLAEVPLADLLAAAASSRPDVA